MSVETFEKQAIVATENYIRNNFENEGSGHDWWHIYRVRNLAMKLAESEGGNLFVIEMAALLHDLDDWKLSSGSESKTERWLKGNNFDESTAENILRVIEQVSFKGARVENKATTIEAKIVQDADRLDAIGAIGIARTFAYGGHKGRPIYNPEVKPVLHTDFESYKNNTAPTINHFYEKLLLLKNSLNTTAAIEIAKNRHIFMETFLQQFFAEWDGKR
jgi:uncharacterized protein